MQSWGESSIETYFVKPVLFQICNDDQVPHDECEYSLERLLEFNQNIIITGAPGSGKTLLLKYIEHVLKGSNKYRSVFISLRDIQFSNSQDIDQVSKELKTVFLLDGLNEVPISERTAVTKKVEELKKKHPSSCFVITSRLIASHEIASFKDFLILRISELSDSQLEHLLILHGISDWRRAISLIQSSVALRGVVRNPFMANLVIQYIDVIASNDYIVDPTLYIDRLVNEYIYKASRSIGIGDQIIDQLLGEMAGFLHYKGMQQLSMSDIYSLTKEFIDNHGHSFQVNVFLDEMERGYVFKSIGPESYSFAHKAIFEHFLTKYLRKLVGYRESRLILDTSQSVITAIKLKGLRNKAALKNVLLGIENTLDLSSTQFTPIYAKEGSIEILLALAIGTATIHAFKKFSDGFFTKLGHISAEKSFSNKKPIILSEEIMTDLPPWIRDNEEAMKIFTNKLVSQYAKNSINNEKEIVSIAINSVLTAQYGECYERVSINEFNAVPSLGNELPAKKEKG